MTKIWDQSGFQNNNNPVEVISDQVINEETYDSIKGSPSKVSKTRIIEIRQNADQCSKDFYTLTFSHKMINSEKPNTIRLSYKDSKRSEYFSGIISIPIMIALVEKIQEIQNES